MARKVTTRALSDRSPPRRRPSMARQEPPEVEAPILKTSTAIASFATLVKRLVRRQASALAASYDALRTTQDSLPIQERFDQWVKIESESLTRTFRNTAIRLLTQRFSEFDAQLGRQIDAQLRLIGATTEIPNRRFLPLSLTAMMQASRLSLGQDPASARRQARMIEQAVRMLVDPAIKRLQGLIDQAGSLVALAALHGTELPTIAFTSKIDSISAATKRQAVSAVWSYQTAAMLQRYVAAGLRYAKWRTQGDGKERSAHKALDGKVFRLDKGLDGKWPGAEPFCRCYPSPMPPGYEPA